MLFLSPSQLLGTISVHLRSLCIRVDERARFVSERELQIFARNAPALTQLCIVGASSLASASIATAAANGKQSSLVLCDEAELAQRARAEEDDGWPCSDLAFMHIAKNCRELRALRVCGNKTGNQAMQHLSLYCPELQHLDLGYKSRCVFSFLIELFFPLALANLCSFVFCSATAITMRSATTCQRTACRR